jgi:hypothetical protein
MTRSYTFKHCWVNVSEDGFTETVFHDGTRVTAMPETGAEYVAKAAQYGYGSDLAALSREHEILHTFLAEARGYGSSPTLWAVAHQQQEGVCAQIWEQEEEETVVLAFQVYLNGGPDCESLRVFKDEGLDLDTLRRDAKRLMR